MKRSPVFIILFLIVFSSCETSSEPEMISLEAGELYIYDLEIYGDEEGASISTQAKHFQRSEIIRDASTDYGAVYYYQSEEGFSGMDSVEIETCTGGTGTGCTDIRTLQLVFRIES
jgi:hypothetical protein